MALLLLSGLVAAAVPGVRVRIGELDASIGAYGQQCR